MTITALQSSGYASVQSSDPKTAKFFRITFPEKGKPMLSIGPGDHTVQRWQLSMEEIRGLVLDCLPELLSRSQTEPR
jgi:hypothetical protein